jgi:hypothetical protein
MNYEPTDAKQIKSAFDPITLRKMGTSALLLLGGTLLTYLSDNLLELITAVGIPDVILPVAVSVFTWLINTVREYLKGQ